MQAEAATPTDEVRDGELSVLVVDDHRTFGDAMCIAVDLQPGLRCLGAVASAEAALEMVEGGGCPDVVLLDISLPGMDGLEAISALRACCPGVRVVLVTADTRAGTVIDAVEAGADGFLPKGFPFMRVLQAVRRIEEDVVAEPLSLERAIRHARDAGPPPEAPDDEVELTDREYEILLLLAEGLPVKQVARRLNLSVHTCRGHVAAILRKFDVHSQLAAVVAAARLGLLPNLHTGPPQL